MFSNILVPVDGSDNSFRALDAALLLSEKLSAKVTAIHILEDIPVLHIQSEKLLRDLLDAYRKENQLILSKCSDIGYKKRSIHKNEITSGKCPLQQSWIFVKKRNTIS